MSRWIDGYRWWYSAPVAVGRGVTVSSDDRGVLALVVGGVGGGYGCHGRCSGG